MTGGQPLAVAVDRSSSYAPEPEDAGAGSRMLTATRYARGFFDLQLQFAETVSTLSGLPLDRTLLEYTNFYIRFGLGRDFDAANPGWQEYLAGLGGTGDRSEWTRQFYASRARTKPSPSVVATFGCFSYARLGTDRIRLHFQNAEPDGRSPLGRACRDQRLIELRALFEHAKRTEPQPLWVVGASWLYNLDAYRRLFPEPYLATAHPLPGRFQHMPLWGQFVDRHGDVRTDMARQFRERLERQSTLDRLDRCFPLPVLRLEAPVEEFCDFYDV